MATTQADISRWFDEGLRQNATHMIVVCDTFDWDDYPVYVKPGQDVTKVVAGYNGPNMQKVMEVYSMRRDKLAQLCEHRSWHTD